MIKVEPTSENENGDSSCTSSSLRKRRYKSSRSLRDLLGDAEECNINRLTVSLGGPQGELQLNMPSSIDNDGRDSSESEGVAHFDPSFVMMGGYNYPDISRSTVSTNASSSNSNTLDKWLAEFRNIENRLDSLEEGEEIQNRRLDTFIDSAGHLIRKISESQSKFEVKRSEQLRSITNTMKNMATHLNSVETRLSQVEQAKRKFVSERVNCEICGKNLSVRSINSHLRQKVCKRLLRKNKY